MQCVYVTSTSASTILFHSFTMARDECDYSCRSRKALKEKEREKKPNVLISKLGKITLSQYFAVRLFMTAKRACD